MWDTAQEKTPESWTSVKLLFHISFSENKWLNKEAKAAGAYQNFRSQEC